MRGRIGRQHYSRTNHARDCIGTDEVDASIDGGQYESGLYIDIWHFNPQAPSIVVHCEIAMRNRMGVQTEIEARTISGIHLIKLRSGVLQARLFNVLRKQINTI